MLSFSTSNVLFHQLIIVIKMKSLVFVVFETLDEWIHIPHYIL